jgi:hypothetical protein
MVVRFKPKGVVALTGIHADYGEILRKTEWFEFFENF